MTERLTKECLKEDGQIELIGKGGRRVFVPVSAELHAAIAAHLEAAGGLEIEKRAYQAAWRRAVIEAGGRATGTHGLRRLSTQQFYRAEYARLMLVV